MRALIEGNVPPNLFHPDEQYSRRSVRIHGGTDVGEYTEAVSILAEKHRVNHVDVHFGGIANKLLKNNHGAALTRDPKLVGRIIKSLSSASDMNFTASFRLGLSWMELTYPQCCFEAQESGGVSAILLESRTATDAHAEDGRAKRALYHIASIVEELETPLLVQGDVFMGSDALKVVKSAGVSGIVIGRESLGRPWLFDDLNRAFNDGWAAEATIPAYGYIRKVVKKHLSLLGADNFGEMKRWYPLYFDGYNGLPHKFVVKLTQAKSAEEVAEILDDVTDDSKIGFKFLKGFGKKTKIGYMQEERRPKRIPDALPKKRGSASQRSPTTLKGNIERDLRAIAKATREEEEARMRKFKAWEEYEKRKRIEM